MTYGIRFTCIGDLVVKVATLGRAGLDDLYATTRVPWSADVRICRDERVVPLMVICWLGCRRRRQKYHVKQDDEVLFRNISSDLTGDTPPF